VDRMTPRPPRFTLRRRVTRSAKVSYVRSRADRTSLERGGPALHNTSASRVRWGWTRAPGELRWGELSWGERRRVLGVLLGLVALLLAAGLEPGR